MDTVFAVVCMGALCVLLAWYEHRFRLGEAIEREVLKERRRVAEYLRRQSRMSEKCASVWWRGQGEERYAADVLDETAEEISECAHHAVSRT